MARPTEEIRELARQFVCVRVTDLRKVDLKRYRFDFDLTFAALTIGPNGAVYHRFGGRDAQDPQYALTMPSLAAFLKASLERHRAQAGAVPLPASKPRTIEDLATFKKRDKEKKVDCVHCHTVNDFEHREAVANQEWQRSQMWVYPDLARLGIEVDRDDQQKIVKVNRSTPGSMGGLKVGDRIVGANGEKIATRADLQWVLHRLPGSKTQLPLEFVREGANEQTSLNLADNWKQCDPLEYAWRPYKWNVTPNPGFGGKFLEVAEKTKLGLDPREYACRVDYLVTWGDRASAGKNAQMAGLRKGDVITAVAGRSDFKSEDHFQSWFRLTQKVGSEIEIAFLREGKPRTLKLKIVE